MIVCMLECTHIALLTHVRIHASSLALLGAGVFCGFMDWEWVGGMADHALY